MFTILVAGDNTNLTHFKENISGHHFADKFYVDNYLNTFSKECDLINDKAKLDEVVLDANISLHEWESNNKTFSLLYGLDIPITQNVLGVTWEPYTDTLQITLWDNLMNETSWKFTKRSLVFDIQFFDPLG